MWRTACLLFLCVNCTIGLEPILLAEDSLKTDRVASGFGGGGGQRSTIAAVPARQIRGTVLLSYPLSDPQILNEAIPIGAPEKMEKHGFYVWVDSQGVWNLQATGTPKPMLGGYLKASGKIEAIYPIDMLSPMDNGSTLDLSGLMLDRNSDQPLKFRSDARHIDFEITSQGSPDPSVIFIGSHARCPRQIPFTVEISPANDSQTRVRTQSDIGDSSSHEPVSGSGGGAIGSAKPAEEDGGKNGGK